MTTTMPTITAGALYGARLRVEGLRVEGPGMESVAHPHAWKQQRPALVDFVIDNSTGVSARERRHT
jgi:hypothetical protein